MAFQLKVFRYLLCSIFFIAFVLILQYAESVQTQLPGLVFQLIISLELQPQLIRLKVPLKKMVEDQAYRNLSVKKTGGTNHSHATKDLIDSFIAGNFLEWKSFVETLDPDYEDRFYFDPPDVAKTRPEDIIPLHPFGLLMLNKTLITSLWRMNSLCFVHHLWCVVFSVQPIRCCRPIFDHFLLPKGGQ